MASTTFTASSAPCTFTLVPGIVASAVAVPFRLMVTLLVVTLPLPVMAASAAAPALA